MSGLTPKTGQTTGGEMSDVIVVGGGVMGMLTARQLLQRGVSVTLIEKSETGTEASWAGGGIVSPLYPWNYVPAISALSSWAQDAYPQLVAQLREETGIDAELNPCGLLMLDPAEFDKAQQWGRDFGKQVDAVGSEFVSAREPAATPDFRRALWLPYVSNVRNPRLLRALGASLQRHPSFKLISHAEVTGLDARAEGVSVQCGHERIHGARVVLCAGAWSASLLKPLGFQLPVVPVRGQMLLFESSPGLIRSIILKDGKYVIPRKDGHILVGSTTEEVGFDKSTTGDARQLLLQHAVNIVPALANVPVVKQWAGLRPGSPGGVPFIGAVPGAPNVFVNAGHYRNGLVLAPASAQLMADLLTGHSPIVDPEPYDPARKREPMAMI